MDSLELIMDMRKTLVKLNHELTPLSGIKDHQFYLDNLKHYKKILAVYISRITDETDEAIEKSKKNINLLNRE